MTDSPTPAEPGPVDPEVELASAHLDGEVDAAERARAGGAVQDHLAELARVSEQVRAVPPPPPGLVDDHVARAMEAFAGDGRVVALDRRRTRPWWQRIPLGAVAAALVVVALIGAVGLASMAGDDDSADTAADETAADSGEAETGTTEEAAAGGTDESTAFDAEAQLGQDGDGLGYASFDALADELRAELAPPDRSDATGAEGATAPTTSARTSDVEEGEAPGSSDPCDAVEVLGVDRADVVVVRDAVVAAEDVTAVVHEASDGRRLALVDHAGCTVVADRLLSRT